jgi:hypothetical protein
MFYQDVRVFLEHLLRGFLYLKPPFYQIKLIICFQLCRGAYLDTCVHTIEMYGCVNWGPPLISIIIDIVFYNCWLHVSQIPWLTCYLFIVANVQTMSTSWISCSVYLIINVVVLVHRHMSLSMFVNIRSVVLLFLCCVVVVYRGFQMFILVVLALLVRYLRCYW